jgi:glycosyltransferase involved in cell wall biosynthesis
MLGPVWDQDLLDALYFHAACYLHGHSVGGTNPSLLRAMGAGTPVIAHDNVFTREVTAGHALFFRDASSLAEALEALLHDRDAAKGRAVRARERVASNYQWDAVAEAYAGLLMQVVGHRAP